MNILHKILPRSNVLSVSFADAESYTLLLFRCRSRKGGTECADAAEVAALGDIRKELTAFPVIVAVGGYGVITKDKSTAGEIANKVMAQDSGFIWSVRGDEISFVREQQLDKLRRSLDEVNAKVVVTECIRHNADAEQYKETVVDTAARFYSENLRFKNIMKPDARGSAFAQLTASKLKLPVLGAVMLALTVNALTAPNVRGRFENARTELEAVRKTVGQTDEASRRQREFLAEYAHALPKPACLICDRAAMVLPESITLTSLAVQPPTRSLENNKKAVFATDRMVIAGESPSSEPVSEYVSALSGLDFARQVHLTSIEKERDGEAFIFKITVDL